MIATLIIPLTLALLQQPAPASAAAAPQTGPWRAWLDCPGGELPFELTLTQRGKDWTGWFANGAERVEIPRVAWDGSELILDITDYDSTIRAKTSKDGTRLDGTWRRRAGADRWAELPFHATFGPSDRFPRVARIPSDPTATVAGRWSVKFATEEDPAIGIFEGPDEGVATGTFLTTTGDYRYLAGVFDGERLQLSAFDGAHAFLLKAQIQDDGTLKGDFWSRDAFHDTWTATKDPKAELPDAFTLTKRTDNYDLAKMAFPDLEGKPRTLADP
ncbi:MAG: hypothetical protein Q7R41_17710, partial [Phycisphaerales bacterium]|nr:hypothetical protein [Phycisphaerales bacterium]